MVSRTVASTCSMLLTSGTKSLYYSTWNIFGKAKDGLFLRKRGATRKRRLYASPVHVPEKQLCPYHQFQAGVSALRHIRAVTAAMASTSQPALAYSASSTPCNPWAGMASRENRRGHHHRAAVNGRHDLEPAANGQRHFKEVYEGNAQRGAQHGQQQKGIGKDRLPKQQRQPPAPQQRRARKHARGKPQHAAQRQQQHPPEIPQVPTGSGCSNGATRGV